MNRLLALLADLGPRLDGAGRHWAVVGGLAVGIRAEPRFTRDIDVAVQVEDDADGEAVVGLLREAGYRVLVVLEQTGRGRMAAVRLAPPGPFAGAVVDLLFASSGIEPEIAREAEAVELVPGLAVPVARLAHLVATKVLARDDESRPQDRADLVALLELARDEELEDARRLLDLISARGFHRGRDLAGDFEDLLGRRPHES